MVFSPTRRSPSITPGYTGSISPSPTNPASQGLLTLPPTSTLGSAPPALVFPLWGTQAELWDERFSLYYVLHDPRDTPQNGLPDGFRHTYDASISETEEGLLYTDALGQRYDYRFAERVEDPTGVAVASYVPHGFVPATDSDVALRIERVEGVGYRASNAEGTRVAFFDSNGRTVGYWHSEGDQTTLLKRTECGLLLGLQRVPGCLRPGDSGWVCPANSSETLSWVSSLALQHVGSVTLHLPSDQTHNLFVAADIPFPLSYLADVVDLVFPHLAEPLSEGATRYSFVGGNLAAITHPSGGTYILEPELILRSALDESLVHEDVIAFPDTAGRGVQLFIDVEGEDARSVKVEDIAALISLRSAAELIPDTFTYDRDGRLTAVRAHDGTSIDLGYDGRGRLSQAGPWSFVWNEPYTEIRFAYGDGDLSTVEYNSQGLIAAYEDPDGFRTQFDYSTNENGLTLIEIYAPGGDRPYAFTTDPESGLVTQIEYPNGFSVENNYKFVGAALEQWTRTDSVDRRSVVRYEVGQAEGSTFYSTGRPAEQWRQARSVDDPEHWTTLQYVERVYDSDTHLLQAVYGPVDGPEDPMLRQIATEYIYDDTGRLTTEITRLWPEESCPVGMEDLALTEYVYRSDGLLGTFRDAEERKTSYEYDARGRLSRMVADPDGQAIETEYAYDDRGNLILLTDPEGNSIAYEYDFEGRLVMQTDPKGIRTRWEYTRGLLVREVADFQGPEQHITAYEYTAGGRLRKRTQDPAGLDIETEYIYDGADRLSTLIDPNGHRTTYEYDPMGRVSRKTVEISEAERAVTEWEYCDCGSLSTMRRLVATEPQVVWQITAFGTDDLGRTELTIRDPIAEGTTCDVRLDPWAQSEQFLNVATLSEFDARGRVVQTFHPRHFDPADEEAYGACYTTNEYNSAGWLVATTDPEGHRTEYDYDRTGLLTAVYGPKRSSSPFERDTAVVVVEGVPQTRQIYDSAGRLVEEHLALEWREDRQEVSRWAVTSYQLDGRGLVVQETNAEGEVTRFVYDKVGLLVATEIEDPQLGNPTHLQTYNRHGQIESETDALSYRISYAYDRVGRLTSITNREGVVAAFAYDDGGFLVEQTGDFGDASHLNYTTALERDWLGRVVAEVRPGPGDPRVWRSTYDLVGNLIRQESPMGSITLHTYDVLGRAIQSVADAGDLDACRNLVTMRVYDRAGNVVAESDALANRTTYTYDRAGRLIATTDPLGREDRHTFDEFGREQAYVNAAGHVTYTYYNLAGWPVATATPLSSLASPSARISQAIAYDRDGRPTAESHPWADVNGNLVVDNHETADWDYTNYNALGLIADVRTNDRPGIQFEYDARGDLIKISAAIDDGALLEISYAYDAEQRLILEDRAGLERVRLEYDPLGAVIKKTTGYGTPDELTTWMEYNDARWVESTWTGDWEDAARFATEYTYDPDGNVISERQPTGETTTHVYNGLGWLEEERIIFPDGVDRVTTFEYDGSGALVRLVTPRENGGEISDAAITWKYDAAGQLVSKSMPGFHGRDQWSYAYTLTGQLETEVDANGWEIRHEYDELGRLIQTTLPDQALPRSYTYSPNSELLHVTDSATDLSFTYDDLGRMVTKTDNLLGKTLFYDYNEIYDVGYMSPEGARVEFARDEVGRLESVNRNGVEVGRYDYNGRGQRTAIVLGNSASTSYDYDARGQLERIVHSSPGAPDRVHRYTRDATGNIVDWELPNGDVLHLEYDAAGQLIQEQRVGATGECLYQNDFAYDLNGNRTCLRHEEFGVVAVTAYEYNTADQLALRVLPSGGIEHNYYDGNGNLVFSISVQGMERHTWDSENRLLGSRRIVAHESTAGVSYTYNALDERVARRTDDENEERYILSESNVIAAWSDAGSLVAEYITPFLDENLLLVGEAGTYYYQQDHLGSVRALLDETGTVVGHYDYTAFGEPWGDEPYLANPYRFSGRPWDEAHQQSYYRARYYEPVIGRFTARDPLAAWSDEDSFGGSYNYVGSNPVRYVDPFGLARSLGYVAGSEPGVTSNASGVAALRRLALAGTTNINLTGGSLRNVVSEFASKVLTPEMTALERALAAGLTCTKAGCKANVTAVVVLSRKKPLTKSMKFGPTMGLRFPPDQRTEWTIGNATVKCTVSGIGLLTCRENCIPPKCCACHFGIVVSAKCRIADVWDFVPGKGRSWKYNAAASAFSLWFYTIRGASKPNLYANWTHHYFLSGSCQVQ